MSATNTINALVPGLAPGQRVYFRLIDQATGYYYDANTQTFGAYSPASVTDYTIAMTDAGAGVYLGTIPAVAASVYLATIYTDFGTSSALDSPVGQQTFAWTGTAIVYGGATAAEVWTYTPRTLTSFGSLVADIWSNGTRTLTSYGTLVSDIWNNGTRTLTGPGSSGLALEATSQQILAALSSTIITVPNPSDGTSLYLVQGDTYSTATGNAISVTVPNYAGPSIVGAVATLSFTSTYTWQYTTTTPAPALAVTGFASMVGPDLVIVYQLTSAQTQTLTQTSPDCASYQAQSLLKSAAGQQLTQHFFSVFVTKRIAAYP